MQLLKKLCSIHAPSGNEGNLTDFLLKYIRKNSKTWKVKPRLYFGDDFQDCIILVFGKPRTAIFAHIDSIGYNTRYGRELIKIGSPVNIDGTRLVGQDSKGKINCELMVIEHENGKQSLEYIYERNIDRGTTLTFKPKWRENNHYVQCCYLDNRLGVWCALKTAETLENGIIVFSCYEEHGGGTTNYLTKFIYEKYQVKQALICDITWVTHGIEHGKGVVISMRDSGIPRRKFLEKIISLAQKSKIPFQLEVESSGGSDGTEIQKSPYPIDWVFIGAPEDNVHTANEMVHKKDIQSMLGMYKYLMQVL
jgi:putative aminopeptidase FrvX